MTEQSYTRVRDIMTHPPHVIDGLASVADAIVHMKQHQVSSLVIEKRHEGDEYGILVVQDIAGKVIGRDRSPKRTSVYEVMSKPVLTVDADMDIKYAIRILARFGLSRGLVTERSRLVGIVTMRDMVLRHIGADTGKADTGTADTGA